VPEVNQAPKESGGAEFLELSVIIPVLNEAESLPALFAMLTRQAGMAMEVILCDGGSTDDTVDQALKLFSRMPFPCRLVETASGRGRQLNAGARLATAETLLFLHADSDFPDPLALRKGLEALRECGRERVAGHYALRFALPVERYEFGYYFYECKARLDRQECTHGDQGFMLRRSFFAEIGPFDETFPLLEDNRLAEAARRGGEWLLLPAEIVTSARRFEVEGLAERQTLNALIMNFAAIGWDDFFRVASVLYCRQDLACRLRLRPFFRAIRKLLRQLPWRQRFALWYRTGVYVRPNAWQLAFALDTRRNFRRGLPAGEGSTPLLDWFDRWYGPLTDHPPGRLAAAVLVWLWFHLTLQWFRFRDKEAQVGECPPN
jgi:rSAM/selenodomain-associated transferase 2